MRRMAAIGIMFALMGAIFVGCDPELMKDLGLADPKEDADATADSGKDAADEAEGQATPNEGNGASDSPDSSANQSVTPPPPPSAADFIPPDALAVVRCSPLRSASNPTIAGLGLRETLINMGRADMDVDLRSPGLFLSQAGAFLDDLEEVILVVDGIRTQPDIAQLMRQSGYEPNVFMNASLSEKMAIVRHLGLENIPDVYGSVMDGYVLRFRGSAPREPARLLLFPDISPQQFQGVPYLGFGMDTSRGAVCYPDDRTIIIGEERVVRRMIAAARTPGTHPGLPSLMNDAYDVTAVFNWPAIRQRLPENAHQDPRIQTLNGALNTGSLAVRVSERPTVKLRLEGYDDTAAWRLEAFIRQRLEDFRQQKYGETSFNSETWEMIRRDIADRVAKDLTVERVGRRLELSLIDSFSMADLATAVERWTAAIHGVALDDGTSVEPPEEQVDSNAVASEIRQLLPAAAGFPFSEYLTFMEAGGYTTPRDFGQQPLSVGLLCTWWYGADIESAYPERFREFRYTTDGPPSGEKVAELLSDSAWLGYCTMLQPDTITNVTCDVDGDRARGVVTFDKPRLCTGKVEYTARRDVGGAWRITSFEMPAHKWKFTRNAEGKWRWTDAFGDVMNADRCPPRKNVLGRVTYQGQPLPGTLEIFHESFPEWPFEDFMLTATVAENGLYSIALPPGDYRVRVQPTTTIPARYGRLANSGLSFHVSSDDGDKIANFDLN